MSLVLECPVCKGLGYTCKPISTPWDNYEKKVCIACWGTGEVRDARFRK